MLSKREWLVERGLAKAGRGKFSNAAKEALSKAESEGVKFSDSFKAVAPKDTGNSVKVSAPSETPYITPSDFRFPEGEWKAKGPDGIVYGMRECCNTCRVSLTNHSCYTPSILGDIPIQIVPA